jgi:hypothetical protein
MDNISSSCGDGGREIVTTDSITITGSTSPDGPPAGAPEKGIVAEAEVGEVLTPQERARLEVLEKAIEASLHSFKELGEYLMEVRDSRLYRESHGTFEYYLEDRWDVERSTGYQIMAAAKAMGNLLPVEGRLPDREWQVRPLAKLRPEQQQQAWERAVRTAPNGKVTGKHVEKVVKEMNAAEPLPVPETGIELALAGPLVNRFVCGDLAEVIGTVPAGSCDLLLILNLPGSTPAAAAENLTNILAAAQTVMRADHQALVLCRFPDSRPVVAAAEQAGYEIGQPIIWTSDRERTVIPWSARSSEYHILHLRRGNAAMHRPTSNVIECPEETFKSHPEQMPLKLVEVLIEAAIPPGAVVLDGTASVGTTNVACKRIERGCIGIESNPKLHALGRARLNEYSGTVSDHQAGDGEEGD